MKKSCFLLATSLLLAASIAYAVPAPRLIISDPANHSGGIPLDLAEIRLFFDQPMNQSSWTLYPVPDLLFPPMASDNERPWVDANTFVLKIQPLAPATSYGVQLNSPTRHGFQSAEDQAPLDVTILRFTTVGAAQATEGATVDAREEPTKEAPASPLPDQSAETPMPSGPATGQEIPQDSVPEGDHTAPRNSEQTDTPVSAPSIDARKQSDPPRLASSTPKNGMQGVPLNLGKLIFSFDQPMKMNTWSLFKVPGKTFPPLKQNGARWEDAQTFLLDIENLEPDTTYALQLNNQTRKGFQTAMDQRPLGITELTFTTESGFPAQGPESTPTIGEDVPRQPTGQESNEAESGQTEAPPETTEAEERKAEEPKSTPESGTDTPLTDEERFILRYYGAVFGVFFHELGHALIDELQLPITGREEDVVDELSTMILLMVREEMRNEATEMILGWASFWGAAAEEKGQKKAPWWDSHSPDMIRFGDIICLLYGSDPEEFEQLMDDLEVPDRRKYQCIQRYKEREESWERLMAPYLSESGATGPGTIHVDLSAEPQSKFGKAVKEVFIDEKVWDELIEGLNTALALPKDFDVKLIDCGEVNAYWSYSERSIFICYDLLEHIYGQYTKQNEDEKTGRSDPEETDEDGVSLVGTWQHQGVDVIGMPALITTKINDDHSFVSVSQAQGLNFEMHIEGRWEVADNNAVIYHVDEWRPRQYCSFNGCQALHLPARHRATYEVIDGDTLKDSDNDVTIYRIK